jgi:hypothetical protein
MTLYLSGQITGDPDYKAKFALAEKALRKAGYDVINPALYQDFGSWEKNMRRDIIDMMSWADGVALIYGWFNSGGARLEEDLAEKLGMRAYYVYHWIDNKNDKK